MKINLSKHGLRQTKPRLEIINFLEERSKKHFQAEEIYQSLRRRGKSLDLATVYRTLETLHKLGWLHKINLSEAHTHYEIRHPQETHFICSNCGRVKENNRLLGRGIMKLLQQKTKSRFKILDFGLEIYGVCQKCAKK